MTLWWKDDTVFKFQTWWTLDSPQPPWNIFNLDFFPAKKTLGTVETHTHGEVEGWNLVFDQFSRHSYPIPQISPQNLMEEVYKRWPLGPNPTPWATNPTPTRRQEIRRNSGSEARDILKISAKSIFRLGIRIICIYSLTEIYDITECMI